MGIADKLDEARQKKNKKAEDEAQQKLRIKEDSQELEKRREANIEKKALETQLNAIRRTDQIKAEAQDELTSFIHHPAPVPLKQVLAGRLRPVPRGTELLAAYKDQRESLKELEEENIAIRAITRNESLFHYVHGIQKEFEANRVKPPEPVPNDMGRGPRGGSPKKNRGANSTMNDTSASWKSRTGMRSTR